MLVLADIFETKFVEYQLCWIRQLIDKKLWATFLIALYFTFSVANFYSQKENPYCWQHCSFFQWSDPTHPITNIVINDLGTQFLDENLAAQNFCFTGKNIFDKVAAYLDATTKLQTAFFEKITTT